MSVEIPLKKTGKKIQDSPIIFIRICPPGKSRDSFNGTEKSNALKILILELITWFMGRG